MLPEGLVAAAGLAAGQLDAIDALTATCNAHDGGQLRLNRDNLATRPTDTVNDFLYYADGKLVGFLPIFIFDPKVAEASGMVDPAYRRQGIFTQLDQAARTHARERGAARYLYMVERGSDSGKGYVTAAGAIAQHSEYAMMLAAPQPVQVRHSSMQLRRATADDAAAMTRILAGAFTEDEEHPERFAQAMANHPSHHWYVASDDGDILGVLNVQSFNGEAGIYGFAVAPDSQGKGYGRQILGQTIATILAEEPRRITLEVATENANALGL